ncbi:MAG: hypothetical protein AAF560_25230 [Acidobacteriota bacterium]
MDHSPRRRLIASLLALMMILGAGAPASACGPYGIVAYFWLPRDPGPGHEAFLDGSLGILDHGLRAPYLYVAFRYLVGLEPNGDNREALSSLWPEPQVDAPNPLQAWRDARARVPDHDGPSWISTSRSSSSTANGRSNYQFFLNCLNDAFANAAETLNARIDRFGAQSPEVRAWLEAQEQVFSNCPSGESIPEPLGPEWDPLIRADRQYQIAAAHFYATHYEQAAEHFQRIAQDGIARDGIDAESPWRGLSAYMVGRALIRDGQYTAAIQSLEALLADAALERWHEPARRLLAYSQLRGAPGERLSELQYQLTRPELTAPLRQDFIDTLWLLDQHHGETDFRDWMQSMRLLLHSAPPSVVFELPASLPKRVAALVTATPETKQLETVLAATRDLGPDSPAFLTAAYHRNRLLAGLGRLDEARSGLDALLEDPQLELALGDRNRLRLLRAEITPELDDYLRLAAVQPLGLGWDDGSSTLPANNDSAYPYYRTSQPMLPDSAVELLNHGLSNAELLRLVEGDMLPESWRLRLAMVTWTRAVVTGDDEIALAAAPLVSARVPELAGEMNVFLEAAPSDRQFAAVWTLLRFPGLSPVLRWTVGRQTEISERDSLRDNGWCVDVLATQELPKQRVRDADQIAAVHAAWPGEGRLPASPDYLGRLVLARAENHPNDPRLPEALHLVVQATRYGCALSSYGETSKAAFQQLHKRFPSSSWAKKTPYWFDS